MITSDSIEMRKKTYRQMLDKIKKALGRKKLVVSYSAYTEDNDGNMVDNLDKIAAKGKVVFVAPSDSFFGGKGSRPYKSKVLENPTWLDVCVVANEMIIKTRDEHHCFLETIMPTGKQEGDVKIFEFLMGS